MTLDAKLLYGILADRKMMMDYIEKTGMKIELSIRSEITQMYNVPEVKPPSSNERTRGL